MDLQVTLQRWEATGIHLESAEAEVSGALARYRTSPSSLARERLVSALAERARARDAVLSLVRAVESGFRR